MSLMQQQQNQEPNLLTQTSHADIIKLGNSISQRCGNFAKVLVQTLQPDEELYEEMYLVILTSIFDLPKTLTQKPVCGKLVPQGQKAFRCHTCSSVWNSLICAQCWQKGNHQGHNFEQFKASDGYCDCGDGDLLKQSGFCTDHKGTLQNIPIEKQQLQVFIKQFQFLFHLLYFLQSYKQKTNQQFYLTDFSGSLAKFLIDFNENSLKSNKMTIQLFKSRLEISQGFDLSQNNTVLQIIYEFDYLHQFASKIKKLFVPLMLHQQFKSSLIANRIKNAKSRTLFLISSLNTYISSMFSMDKVMSRILEQQKQLLPYQVKNINSELPFAFVCKIYQNYFNDIDNLGNVKQGLWQQYRENLLWKGNICNLSGYSDNAWLDQTDNINYYEIQMKALNLLAKLLGPVRHDKQLLVKLMKQITQFLDSPLQNSIPMGLFMPKQRSLCMLIYLYFEGDQLKGANKKFLDQIGFTANVLHRLLQQTLYVIRFYALTLSNKSAAERYYYFLDSTCLDKPSVLMSLDFQLIKFCVLAAQNFEFTDAPGPAYENLEYEGVQTFQQIKSPIEYLLLKPLHYLASLLIDKDVEQKTDANNAYDRQKATNFLSTYISILHVIVKQNYSDFLLRNFFKLVTKEQMIKFYGKIIKTTGQIEISSLKEIFYILFGNDKYEFLEQFLKEYCTLQNQKINLNSQSKNEFSPFEDQWLKLYKYSDIYVEYFQKSDKNLASLPHQEKNQSSLCLKMKQILFGEIFIDQILNNMDRYTQILQSNQKILKTDFPHYENLLKELLILNKTFYNKPFIKFLCKVAKKDKIYDRFSQKFKLLIFDEIKDIQTSIYSPQKSKQNIQLQKLRAKQVKQRKMQKFKTKQSQALQKLINKNQFSSKEGEKEEQQQFLCIICRIDEENQPLAALSSLYKSTVFSQLYLGKNFPVFILTGCGHFAHYKCLKSLDCNYCMIQAKMPLAVKKKQFFTKERKDQVQLGIIPQIKKSIQKIYIGSLGEKDSIQFEMFVSLSTSIALASLADFQFFVKKQANLYYLVYHDLRRQKIDMNETIKKLLEFLKNSEINPNRIQFLHVYEYTMKLLTQRLYLKQELSSANENMELEEQQISEQVKLKVDFIINHLNTPEGLNQLKSAQLIPSNPPEIRQLPKSFEQLNKLVGKCPNCSHVTNEIAICLQCDFISCIGCKDANLTAHATAYHGEFSIFVRADIGAPIYINGNKNAQFKPIYVNSIGSSYYAYSDYQRKDQFLLISKGYEKIKKDLIRHQVRNQILDYQRHYQNKRFKGMIP